MSKTTFLLWYLYCCTLQAHFTHGLITSDTIVHQQTFLPASWCVKPVSIYKVEPGSSKQL